MRGLAWGLVQRGREDSGQLECLGSLETAPAQPRRCRSVVSGRWWPSGAQRSRAVKWDNWSEARTQMLRGEGLPGRGDSILEAVEVRLP